MRIGLLAPLLERVPPVKYGGTERVIGWLADELTGLGHDVDLYATADCETKATLVPLAERALWKTDLRDYAPVRMAAFARAFAECEADVMHSHAEWAAYPFIRTSRVPSVTTVHSRTDTAEAAIVHAEFSDVPLVSVSKAQRRQIPSAGWVANVPHGLPVDLYRPRTKRGSYLAFVGRISPEKGVHLAIEVAHRSGLPLVIGGRPPLDVWAYPEAKEDRAYWEEMIQPHLGRDGIEFVGELDDRGKQELLQDALAFLFPIDWPEPFGIVLIEAMACGTPILARPRGSVPEIVVDGVNGYHCEDVGEMTKAIDRIDRIDRAACRRVFDERFTSRRMALDYVRVYSEALARSKQERVLRVAAEEETAAI
ncbi:MAG: glycosyltransferase family 4 protein [Chloroflexota bacterium]|nr:glycosyltransferase family 4 protein [Chloroflexota bacterium]MDE3194112.1 glycosyltransferase family 4 protein [Chloroflexota bacterium]